jgi:hypothetical protein
VFGLLVAAVMVVGYFIRKGTYLLVSYPGSTTSIRVKMFGYNAVTQFVKGLQTYMKK